MKEQNKDKEWKPLGSLIEKDFYLTECIRGKVSATQKYCSPYIKLYLDGPDTGDKTHLVSLTLTDIQLLEIVLKRANKLWCEYSNSPDYDGLDSLQGQHTLDQFMKKNENLFSSFRKLAGELMMKYGIYLKPF